MAIWVLVADASRARLFEAENRKAPLQEKQDWMHPASRLHEGDLVSDDNGRREGPGGRHGVASEPVHKQAEEDRFAQELAQVLEDARKNDAFVRLYLIAPPKFLGSLRKHASKELQEKIADEIAKDLSTHSVDDIRRQLPKVL